MISHKKKFVLITPPKTGSNSLIRTLQSYIEIHKPIHRRGDDFEYTETETDVKESKHKSYEDYHLKINKEYKLYGSIRNPFHRMVSWWRYFLAHRQLTTESYDFTRFLTQSVGARFVNMVDYFSYENEIIVKNFIRLESIQQDFNKFCDDVSIPHTFIERRNEGTFLQNKEEYYSQIYTDVTKKLVETTFKRDLEYFNYSFI